MKKAYSISILTLLPLAHNALAHSGEVIHIHPHGQNAYLTTWLVAAALAVALGARYLVQRSRQK